LRTEYSIILEQLISCSLFTDINLKKGIVR
jgi:hypothetical protein